MEYVAKTNYKKNRSYLKIIISIILLIIIATIIFLIIQKNQGDKIPKYGTLVQGSDTMMSEDLS